MRADKCDRETLVGVSSSCPYAIDALRPTKSTCTSPDDMGHTFISSCSRRRNFRKDHSTTGTIRCDGSNRFHCGPGMFHSCADRSSTVEPFAFPISIESILSSLRQAVPSCIHALFGAPSSSSAASAILDIRQLERGMSCKGGDATRLRMSNRQEPYVGRTS